MQAQGGQHVALGRDAEAAAAPFEALHLDIQPQVVLHLLDFVALGVGLYLLEYLLHLLQLEVNQVVHQALPLGHMLAEQFEVEARLRREGVLDVGVKVDRLQAAAVVRAQRYLAAGVGADGAVAEVSIAVGHTFADDGVPVEHTRLGAAPRVGDNLVPQRACVYFFSI